MYVVIANKQFERIGLIENVEIIWASRYYETGDFELHMVASKDNLKLINEGYYVVKDDDEDNIGVIEDLEIKSSAEKGDTLVVTGRFAEGYILDSRVVAKQTILSGNVQLQVRKLVEISMINAVDTNRNIEFVKLGALDEKITDKITMQTTGAKLLKKVEEISEAKQIGFRMPLVKNQLHFEMYKGVDHSYGQSANPWVVFSDEYDNLLEAQYIEKKSLIKNVAYVAGEGEGIARKVIEAYKTPTPPKGIDRHEIWVDQRNMSTNNGEITEQQINLQMLEEGLEKLVGITIAFEGSVSLSGYTYGKAKNGGDFYLGDIVSIKMKKWNNMYINARVVEVIESYDTSGKQTILTFGI